MEQQLIIQEILLVTGSSFYSRQFCRKITDECEGKLSSMEELERACWDGILYEILPELVGNSRNSYIRKTASGVNFLFVSMGIDRRQPEKQTSINPYNYFTLLSTSFN